MFLKAYTEGSQVMPRLSASGQFHVLQDDMSASGPFHVLQNNMEVICHSAERLFLDKFCKNFMVVLKVVIGICLNPCSEMNKNALCLGCLNTYAVLSS